MMSEKSQRYNLLPRFGHLQDDAIETPQSYRLPQSKVDAYMGDLEDLRVIGLGRLSPSSSSVRLRGIWGGFSFG